MTSGKEPTESPTFHRKNTTLGQIVQWSKTATKKGRKCREIPTGQGKRKHH